MNTTTDFEITTYRSTGQLTSTLGLNVTFLPGNHSSDVTEAEAHHMTDITADVIVYITIGVLGIVGNGFSAFVIATSKVMLKTTTNVLILNQCIVDFVCSVSVIAQAHIVYGQGGFYDLEGLVKCQLWTSKVIQWSLFISSTSNLVAVTLEKYIQIRYPILHHVSCTNTKIGLVIFLVWLSGPLINFPLVIPTSYVDPATHQCRNMQLWPSDLVRRLVGVLTVIVEFIIPLIIIICSYLRMFQIIRGRVQPMRTESSINPMQQGIQSISRSSATDLRAIPNAPSLPQTGRRERLAKCSRNIVKTLLTSSVCFFVCWVWNQSFFLLFNLGYPVDYNGYFYHFTVYMVLLNIALNPLIYTVRYRQFQHCVRAKLCHRNNLIDTNENMGALSSPVING